jgi:hypothetical protein
MHVDIEYMDKPGWTYVRSNWVRIRVTLTDEERAIVAKHRMGKRTLITIPIPASKKEMYEPEDWAQQFTIDKFCSSSGFLLPFDTPAEAQDFGFKIRESLKNFKEVIERSGSPGRNESFDL